MEKVQAKYRSVVTSVCEVQEIKTRRSFKTWRSSRNIARLIVSLRKRS